MSTVFSEHICVPVLKCTFVLSHFSWKLNRFCMDVSTVCKCELCKGSIHL